MEKVKSYQIKFILFGLALLLFSGLFKLYYQDRDWLVNHQASHFQEALNDIDARLFEEIRYYKSIMDTAGLEALLQNDVSHHQFLESEGIAIYVYSDSNLKFWSSNKFIIPK